MAFILSCYNCWHVIFLLWVSICSCCEPELICERKCLIQKLRSVTKDQVYQQCMKVCMEHLLPRTAESLSKNVLILGAEDTLPPGVYMPDKIPLVPFKVQDEYRKRMPNEDIGCSRVPFSNNPFQIPREVQGIMVACHRGNGDHSKLVITWKKPMDFNLVKGYQILYRVAKESRNPRSHCVFVERDATGVVISSMSEGLFGPVLLAVVALPVKSSFTIPVKKYEGCRQDTKTRQRRNYPLPAKKMSFLKGPPNTPLILPPGATLPPGIIIPSVIPTLPKGIVPDEHPNCKSQVLQGKPNDTSLKVKGLHVYCELQGVNRTVYARWQMPDNAARFNGFQISYSLMLPNVYDPSKTYCMEVGKEARAATIVEGVVDQIHIFLNVVPLPIYHNQIMVMQKFKACGVTIQPTDRSNIVTAQNVGSNPPDSKDTILSGVVGGVVGGVFVLLILGLIMHRRRKQQVNTDVQSGEKRTLTYFSHCLTADQDVERLLSLAARLNCQYGIPCILDLLEQQAINMATLPVWCNRQLARADKIIVVVSQEYLSAVQKHIETPDCTIEDINILKILNDVVYIQQHLMEQGGRNAKVICLLSSVDKNSLPDFMKMRPVHQWPPPGSEEELNLIRCLTGVEDRALVV